MYNTIRRTFVYRKAKSSQKIIVFRTIYSTFLTYGSEQWIKKIKTMIQVIGINFFRVTRLDKIRNKRNNNIDAKE